ncbi:NAD(P)/FAD-dependent oxidoreductase [Niallia endozanthoxylica]|uniref:Glutamate synthase subunit beta n=1 Tax=Niallia endozanthoxylica TaxID=2036016 RepID=A0A5J5HQ27_9BACI|nr:FAD-dependent monooxygenase [Niallia endozanthoxylica]KAA9023829.1 glutamate synthase subunit beta [Niallia endozanthoxylica]
MFNRQKAIIIGGGISGKLAARVLSDFFKEVIVIERDNRPIGPFPRKGARQGEHIHALLLAGQYGLERLFPGITEKFYTTGAVEMNSTKDLSWFHHGVWKLRYDGHYRTTLQTRPHLEWHIEQSIDNLSNVTVFYNQSVRNILYHAKKNRVYGVEIVDKEKNIRTLTADLIVDASGSSSITTSWLETLGIQIPREQAEIGLTYVSKFYQLPDNKTRDWKIKMIYPDPPAEKIGGTVSLVEGERYTVTIMGYQNAIKEKEVVKNDQGFLELAKKLPQLDIYHEIKDGTPLSATSIYRIPKIIWKRFDQVKQLPNGLMLIGDTICRIDPVFGQGMSIAVFEALALQKIFQDGNCSLQKNIINFHKKARRIISPIWNMVVTEDFRYPGIIDKKPISLSIQQWYAKKIFLLSSQHQDIYDSFAKVMNLLEPMTILIKPEILKRVLRHTFSKK